MGIQLVTIKNKNGESGVFKISTEQTLSAARQLFMENHLMEKEDSFLFHDSAVDLKSEDLIFLYEILDGDQVIHIGEKKGEGIQQDPNVEDYSDMTRTQREDLFRRCQVFRGLILNPNDGIRNSFYDLFSWKKLPSMNRPKVNTQEISCYSFSKITKEINLITDHKETLALESPFLDVSSEYHYEKKQSSESSETREYLLEKYQLLKAEFSLQLENLIPNPDFVQAIAKVISSPEGGKDKMCNLLHVLDQWGYYFPNQFTLGGMIYSTETTTIRDFSQSETEQKAFSASVKAKFNESASSGGSAGQTQESEEKESSSQKYKNIVLNQIGGKTGLLKNKDGLSASLDMARYWDIVDINSFYPSLILLDSNSIPADNRGLLASCLSLINQNYHHGAVKKIQPYLDMMRYATQVETIIDPF